MFVVVLFLFFRDKSLCVSVLTVLEHALRTRLALPTPMNVKLAVTTLISFKKDMDVTRALLERGVG